MPTKALKQVNNIAGGLITETSALGFPDNAAQDIINFKLNRDGSVQRRLGLDYEEGYTLHATGFTEELLSRSRMRFFHWPSPSGYSDVDIGIFQIGGELFFADLLRAAPSSNLLNQQSSLNTGLQGNVIMSFSLINNKVVVVSEALPRPLVLSYNAVTDVVTSEQISIKIRDLYGVEDSLEVNERPTILTNEHKYNLRNQGWAGGIQTTCGSDPLDCMQTNLGVYPSNSDTWSLGKIADVSDADVDKFDPETLNRNSFDIGRAARGHHVIDLYDRGNSREDVSGIPLSPVDRETGLVSVSTTYAGRIFYSGISSRVVGGDKFSPNMTGSVLFSQVVTNDGDIGKCYQEADPTSPTDNDVVDTDGGVINISGIVGIVALMSVRTSLFVFASNGVWQIRGDDGGFRATSFQVNKISSIGVFSPESIVEANGVIFFWATSGIYSLTPNQVDNITFDTTNVTLNTIQRAYDSLPDLIKKTAKGYYDLKENSIRWLFKSDEDKVIGQPVEIQPDIPFNASFGVDDTLTDFQVDILDLANADGNKFVLIYKNLTDNRIEARVVSTTGTSHTLHTPLVLRSPASSAFSVMVKKIDSNTVLVYYDYATKKVAKLRVNGDNTLTQLGEVTLTVPAGYNITTMAVASTSVAVLGITYAAGSQIFIHPLDISGNNPVQGGFIESTVHSANVSIRLESPEILTGRVSAFTGGANGMAWSLNPTTLALNEESGFNINIILSSGNPIDVYSRTAGNTYVTTVNHLGGIINMSGSTPEWVQNSEGNTTVESGLPITTSVDGIVLHTSGKASELSRSNNLVGVVANIPYYRTITQGADNALASDADDLPSNSYGSITPLREASSNNRIGVLASDKLSGERIAWAAKDLTTGNLFVQVIQTEN